MMLNHRLRRLGRDTGQATVEYVGLALAVAVLLMGVGGALGGHGEKISSAIAKRLTQALQAQGGN